MAKILGIVASQRRLGNSEILVKEAARAAGAGHTLELVRLADFNLQPCKGCYTCLAPGKLCPQKDDLYFLADKIAAADAVILSGPCYAMGPAAVTKLFGDRIIALAQRIGDFWGKPCVVIGTAGIKGVEGYTLSALVAEARFMGWAVKDASMFLGALPGEGVAADGALDRVRLMGERLFGPARQPVDGECPTCWSELWKFPQPDSAVCPFCGQQAHLTVEAGAVHWQYGEPGPRFTLDWLKNHFQGWLREKVEEYVQKRKELAAIRNVYKTDDVWLSRE